MMMQSNFVLDTRAASAGVDSMPATVGVVEQRWWGDDHDGWGGGGWLFMMGFMVFFRCV